MNFRSWVQNKWYEHLDELDSLMLPRPNYDVKHYFQKYKWWLKREYQFQKSSQQS
jgi:hypothetical protein